MIIKILAANKFRKKHAPELDINDKTIIKNVFNMAWPSTLETVLIALISTVDTIMVSSLGHQAISAVGVTNQPRMVLLSFVLALNLGVVVLVSRRKGQNDSLQANRVLHTSILISFFLSLLTNSIGFFFAKDILVLAGANQDYLLDAISYFKVICIGNFFYSISLTITSAQRGAGNTKISMVTNILANVVNIFFNYLLINGIWIFPRLEVTGAAIATAIGNVVALSVAIYSLLHKSDFLTLNFKKYFTRNFTYFKQIYSLSWPSTIEQVFLRIGFFVFAKQVFELGTTASSTHQILMNMLNLSFSIGDGLSVAATTLVGQSLGANNIHLAKVYGKSVQQFGRMMAVCLSFVLLIFRFQIISLFTDYQPIIDIAQWLFIVLAILINFQVSQTITLGCLRGAGDIKFVAMISMISIMLVRPTLTYFLAYTCHIGIYGAWMAIFIDQFTRWIVSLLRYNYGQWIRMDI